MNKTCECGGELSVDAVCVVELYRQEDGSIRPVFKRQCRPCALRDAQIEIRGEVVIKGDQ